jgi:Ca2+-binding EF-hand superfamily protein
MFRLIAILSVAGLFSASPAFADDKPKGDKPKGKHPDPEALFKRLDADNDGKISKEEFAKFADIVREKAKEKGKGKNANGRAADAIFNRLDTNGDGYLSLEEFKKLSEIRQKKKDK